jgi:tRNA-dihydrouridine synthase
MLKTSPCRQNYRPLSCTPFLHCADARLDGQTLPLFPAPALRHTLLYTEMVTTGAIIHGKGDYLA